MVSGGGGESTLVESEDGPSSALYRAIPLVLRRGRDSSTILLCWPAIVPRDITLSCNNETKFVHRWNCKHSPDTNQPVYYETWQQVALGRCSQIYIV